MQSVFSCGLWTLPTIGGGAIEELNIWDHAPAMKVAAYKTMGVSLRFGQPSLLRLDNGDVLATHWASEDGQGRIRTHRLSVRS